MTHATGRWRKSSRSGQDNNSGCVEARLDRDQLQLSDSQHGGVRPIMDVARPDYLGLITSVKAS